MLSFYTIKTRVVLSAVLFFVVSGTSYSNWKTRAVGAVTVGLAGTAGWHAWQESKPEVERPKSIKEKPAFLQRSDYKHGKYLSFNPDETGFVYACCAGGFARVLFSVAMSSNKLESFFSAVLRPGITKSLLFWIPSIVAYQMVIRDRETEVLESEKSELKKRIHELEKKFEQSTRSRYEPSMVDPFGQYSNVHSLDREDKKD